MRSLSDPRERGLGVGDATTDCSIHGQHHLRMALSVSARGRFSKQGASYGWSAGGAFGDPRGATGVVQRMGKKIC